MRLEDMIVFQFHEFHSGTKDDSESFYGRMRSLHIGRCFNEVTCKGWHKHVFIIVLLRVIRYSLVGCHRFLCA